MTSDVTKPVVDVVTNGDVKTQLLLGYYVLLLLVIGLVAAGLRWVAVRALDEILAVGRDIAAAIRGESPSPNKSSHRTEKP